MIALIVAAVAAAAWAYLLFFHGRFWRADQRLARAEAAPARAKVVAIVPARNEADVIDRAVTSLLGQRHAEVTAVFLCDDGSTDGTAEAARKAAGGSERLTIVTAPPRPEGWTGKLWAMETARTAAAEAHPDAEYWWFADADIEHGPQALASMLTKAQAEPQRVLVSLMVRLHCGDLWERLLIPAFVYFFQMLYPFAHANAPGRKLAAAAGGSMLARGEALQAGGGLPAIRDRVIDDCALAALMKRQGPIWLGLAERSRSLRPYEGLGGVWRMVARTAYVQLQRNPLILLGCVLGLGLVFLVPPLAALFGALTGQWIIAGLGLFGWAAMTLSLRPTQALYGLGPLWTLTLPIAATLYLAMTIDSARRDWVGLGNAWKGRAGGGVASA